MNDTKELFVEMINYSNRRLTRILYLLQNNIKFRYQIINHLAWKESKCIAFRSFAGKSGLDRQIGHSVECFCEVNPHFGNENNTSESNAVVNNTKFLTVMHCVSSIKTKNGKVG